MSDIVVGLDIGTSNVRVVIAEYDENNRLRIVGLGKAPSTGLRSGVIVNIEATMRAVTAAIEAAELMSGYEVHSCFVGIGGTQVDSLNSTGQVSVSNKSKEINQNDINRVIETASHLSIPLDRQVLHVVPQMYTVEHGVNMLQKTKDPINVIGTRLYVDVHIVTATTTTVQNIFTCASRAGYTVDGVMLKTLATAQAVLTDEEKELGSILIDMGGGSTDVIVVADGAPICTDSVPIGGLLVTNDISVVRGISTETAEKIKISDGCCWEPLVDKNEEVLILGVNGRPESIPRTELCDIIQPRVGEIFEMIREKISAKIKDRRLSGNVVLVGGGAKMSGVIELASTVFNTESVRIGLPSNLGGLTDEYRTPDSATAIGLVVANSEVLQHKGEKRSRKDYSRKKQGFMDKIAKFFEDMF
ncbi:MAG: cell division protein FtsA [Treponemataceae bacterium]|nr:cell division protein FtsA [Treponemataceae bacterium]